MALPERSIRAPSPHESGVRPAHAPKERAREKQASREEDAGAVASGLRSREEIASKNVFVSASRFEIDFSRAVPLK
jgi:hypothetical protein